MHDIGTPFGEPGFLVLAGSRLYGIETPESDYDYTGALVEPIGYRVGLMKYKEAGGDTQAGFEQHHFSGDNYEGTVYSLWKLSRMFAEGNPTILCLLFGTPLRDDYGVCTDEFRAIVRSRCAGHRFLRYMQSQRRSMLNQRSKHVTRLDLIDRHGYDTKFAAHVIRLAYQGIEYMNTGHVTLPMPPEERTIVRQIRAGEISLTEVIDMSHALESDLTCAYTDSDLPSEPDFSALSAWVVDRYQKSWITS